ncbi:MAG: hypothetical protein D6794_02000 [Deltaproteobacteria bacterium]|nr:MAG: hypothetical protein D6794_02000 [Deltaproteobacteria bacterium]
MKRMFNLNILGLVLRLYAFMWFVILAGFAGLPWAVTLSVGMLIFLTGLLGVPFHAGEAIERQPRQPQPVPSATGERQPLGNMPRAA